MLKRFKSYNIQKMKRLLFFAVGSIVYFSSSYAWADRDLIIATGGKEGIYWAIGNGLKEVFEKQIQGLSIKIVQTSGSIENTYILAENKADLAFIQNDIAFYSHHGQGMFQKPNYHIKGVASLYPETVHIIVRKDSLIRNIKELIGKKIAVGPENSGTKFNAQQIIELYDISWKDVIPQYIELNKAAQLLQKGDIDAIFLTVGLSAHDLVELSKTFAVRFLSIDDQHLTALIKRYPYYVANSIPRGIYIGQDEPVKAVAVKALLIASDKLNQVLMYKITKALFPKETQKVLSSIHPIAKDIKLVSALEGMSIYLHKGAKTFYEKNGLIKSSHAYIILWTFIIISFLLAFLIFIRTFLYAKKKHKIKWLENTIIDTVLFKFKKYQYIVGLFLILSLLLLDANIIQYFETKYEMEQPGVTVQDYYDTKKTLVWLYVLAGCGYYDQRFPQTTIGKIAAATLPLIGIGGL